MHQLVHQHTPCPITAPLSRHASCYPPRHLQGHQLKAATTLPTQHPTLARINTYKPRKMTLTEHVHCCAPSGHPLAHLPRCPPTNRTPYTHDPPPHTHTARLANPKSNQHVSCCAPSRHLRAHRPCRQPETTQAAQTSVPGQLLQWRDMTVSQALHTPPLGSTHVPRCCSSSPVLPGKSCTPPLLAAACAACCRCCLLLWCAARPVRCGVSHRTRALPVVS